MPAKTSDSRAAGFIAEHGANSAVELDALEPNVLQQLITDSIEQYLDFGILKERNQALTKGKAEIKEMIKASLNRDRLPTKKYPKRKQ